MEVYATLATQESLRREFSYIFEEKNLSRHTTDKTYHHQFRRQLQHHRTAQSHYPIRVMHYKLEVLGFRIGPFHSYITDANYIAPEELAKARGSQAFVLNALRHEQHISHYTFAEAMEIARETGSKDIYFTHISHQLGLHTDIQSTLPSNMHLAYDGLVLEF